MKLSSSLSVLLLAGSLISPTPASAQTPAKSWDRSNAMAAVQAVDIDQAVADIGDVSSLADGTVTLRNLKNIETRSDWPVPARDAAIYQFTQSLAELPRDAVAVDVIQHLRNYRAQTLVPHEDHGEALVPLFNIRSAAAGVENGWQRTEFTVEARQLLEADPELLVSGYATSTNHNQRSAYLAALRYADMAAVTAVQTRALQDLGKTPALTAVVAVTSAITTDTFAVQQLLINGHGAGLTAALVQLDQQLPATATAELLTFAIENAPPGNAALALAAWWPRLRHDTTTRELVLETLADPLLGSAAALALAQSPDTQTIMALQRTATGDSVAAQRAQMALDIHRDQLLGQATP